MAKFEFEKRIRRDENGFYNVQIRILPLEDWEMGDGWRTTLITSIYENAKKKLEDEPGREVA